MPLALPGRAQVRVPAGERPQKTPQVLAHTCGVWGESSPILRENKLSIGLQKVTR